MMGREGRFRPASFRTASNFLAISHFMTNFLDRLCPARFSPFDNLELVP